MILYNGTWDRKLVEDDPISIGITSNTEGSVIWELDRGIESGCHMGLSASLIT